MAATPDPDKVLRSSKKRDNFQRLTRLLMSGGTVLLREVFDIRCPPKDLPTKLKNSTTKKKLEKILDKTQMKCLHPSSEKYGESREFDITLLYKLLTNICGVKPPAATESNGLPVTTDHSLEADLLRIKWYRNSIYAHVIADMEITDNEFQRLWREISETLVRIAGQISPAKAKEWQNAIDTFLNDPLTEEDKRHEQELQRWYQNDTEVKENLEKVDSSMKHLEKEFKYLRQEFQEGVQDMKNGLERKIESAAEEAKRRGQDVKDELEEKLQRLRQEVHDEFKAVKDLLINLGSQLNSSAGGQLVEFCCISFTNKIFFI